MSTQHWQKCEAPICSDESCYEDGHRDWDETVIWYVDEPYCKRSPYTKWQKKQAKMSRLYKRGLFKHPERYWTVAMLEKRKRVNKGMKGGNPDAMTWE